MGFKDLSLKLSYRSNRDNLINDFYLPLLSNSKEYYRGAGFFSVTLLNKIGKGLYSFIKNNGKMRLVTGIELSPETIDQVDKGYALKQQLLEKEISKQIDKVINDLANAYMTTELSNICWMIAHGNLDIKVATRLHNNKVSRGIYHEKIAIFVDEQDDKVGTIGSINETEYAYVENFESFDVFKSWGSEESYQRIKEKLADFDNLWENETEGLLIYNFSYAQKERLIKLSPSHLVDDKYECGENKAHQLNEIKRQTEPFDYQKIAIQKWCMNKYTGILEMATGTGKTYTSLFCVEKYLEDNIGKSFVTLVCCPYQHLVDQWEKSVKEVFPDVPIVKCYVSQETWHDNLTSTLQKIVLKQLKHAVIITTVTTGSSPEFIRILNSSNLNKIVICDEVHNIGSSVNRRFMSIAASARLGLSATPIRPFDEEGNGAISDYFGKTVYTLGIKQAIKMKFLVPYYYHIYFCELNEMEYESYKEISIEIARLYSNKRKPVNEDKLTYLLIKRSNIISSCEKKLINLEKIIEDIENPQNLLVYTAEDPSFFEQTLDVLNGKGIRTLKVTADVKNFKRKEIVTMLEEGNIDSILAMRCLDEGVDIPSADKAIILASSINEKQYIQRRGRVLRKDPKGKKQYAEIYDTLVVPPEFSNEMDRGLFERELRRVLEFALISKNECQLIEEIQSFCRENKLMKNFVNIFYERSLEEE